MATSTAGQQAADLLRQRHEHLESGTDEQAERIREKLHGSLAELEQDTDLTALAKRERGDLLRQEARQQMDDLRAGYEQRRRDLDVQARRAAFGAAPDGAAGLVAHRDAVDRAQRLDRADEARASMRHAIETGDRQLARAIAARAHDRGWVDVVEQWGQHGGSIELAYLLADLEGDLQRRRRAGSFRWIVGGGAR